jgi:hypothetical protein
MTVQGLFKKRRMNSNGEAQRQGPSKIHPGSFMRRLSRLSLTTLCAAFMGLTRCTATHTGPAASLQASPEVRCE